MHANQEQTFYFSSIPEPCRILLRINYCTAKTTHSGTDILESCPSLSCAHMLTHSMLVNKHNILNVCLHDVQNAFHSKEDCNADYVKKDYENILFIARPTYQIRSEKRIRGGSQVTFNKGVR